MGTRTLRSESRPQEARFPRRACCSDAPSASSTGYADARELPWILFDRRERKEEILRIRALVRDGFLTVADPAAPAEVCAEPGPREVGRYVARWTAALTAASILAAAGWLKLPTGGWVLLGCAAT